MFSFGSKKAERRREVRSSAAERRPRLERRNASKNIDYEASWPSNSSDEALPLRTTRSLDLSPTSFRIGGSIEGEFEHLCHSLGLSGPEDFAISDATWEASIRARSSSDLLPRSRLHSDSLLSQPENPMPASGLKAEETAEPAAPNEEIRVRDEETVEISHSFANESSGADGGVRGPRPPVFAPPLSPAEVLSPPSAVSVHAPPPSMTLLVDDRPSTTWDLVRSFTPPEENEEGAERRSLDSNEEEEKMAESGGDTNFLEERGTVVGVVSENGAGSSNDEDSSNTTKEFIISPSGRFKKKIRSWMRGQLLGSGSFGTVYEGISDDGTFIAVKEVSLMDKGSSAQQCIVQLEQEIALLSQFEHENVVQYYGTDKEESKLFIFLELATQGSLASLYKKYHLRDTQVSAYTRQILNGLNYLHVQSVVHRDIKCANILVHANGSVKLADFGLAKEISKFNDLKSCKGSVYWMAPEVVNPRKTYGSAADIWSLGCTVLEMLNRQIPFPNVEWQHAFYKIGRGEQPPIPSHLSSDARDFIRQCVQVDPKSRPTAAELLEHPFVRRPLET